MKKKCLQPISHRFPKTDSNNDMQTHIWLRRDTVHRRMELQQNRQRSRHFALWGERRGKNESTLSCYAFPWVMHLLLSLPVGDEKFWMSDVSTVYKTNGGMPLLLCISYWSQSAWRRRLKHHSQQTSWFFLEPCRSPISKHAVPTPTLKRQPTTPHVWKLQKFYIEPPYKRNKKRVTTIGHRVRLNSKPVG